MIGWIRHVSRHDDAKGADSNYIRAKCDEFLKRVDSDLILLPPRPLQPKRGHKRSQNAADIGTGDFVAPLRKSARNSSETAYAEFAPHPPLQPEPVIQNGVELCGISISKGAQSSDPVLPSFVSHPDEDNLSYRPAEMFSSNPEGINASISGPAAFPRDDFPPIYDAMNFFLDGFS